jgi:hypothetical protein
MERRKFLKTTGTAIGAISATTGTVVGDSGSQRGPSGIDTDFRPSQSSEIGRFVVNILNQFESKGNINKNSFQHIEDKLSDKQLHAVGEYLSNNIEMRTYQKKKYSPANSDIMLQSSQELDNTQNTSTGDAGRLTATSSGSYQRAEFENDIDAYIEVGPILQYCGLTPCYKTFTFHAFNFSTKLEWFYDNSTVQNAAQHVSGNGNYYGVVGWNYQGADENIRYHPDNYYVESYAKGKFKRTPFHPSLPGQMDYGSIELVGHSWGGGRVEEEQVIE